MKPILSIIDSSFIRENNKDMEKEPTGDFYTTVEARLSVLLGERSTELVDILRHDEGEWERGPNDFKRTVNTLVRLIEVGSTIERNYYGAGKYP